MYEGLNPRQRQEMLEEFKRHLKISAESDGSLVYIKLEWSDDNSNTYAASEVISTCSLYLDYLPYELKKWSND
jgi:hypothetical protein